jgi:hypothetical protein
LLGAIVLGLPLGLLAGAGGSDQTIGGRSEIGALADPKIELHDAELGSSAISDGTWTVRYDRSRNAQSPANLSGRLAEVEDVLKKLALTCAPTSADGDAVKESLGQLVSDIGIGRDDAVGSQRVPTTETERRSIEIAYQLSQVLGFVFDQLDWYVDSEAAQQRTDRATLSDPTGERPA